MILILSPIHCLADDDIEMMYHPHFKIYFHKNLNAPILTSETSGDLIFDFAAEVRSALVNAYEKYGEVKGSSSKGFKLPENNKVIIDDWGAEKTADWDWFSKDIDIPVTYSNLKDLQHDAAHELFHNVQNQYINFTTMHAWRWWMEATADYAAAYIGTGHGLRSELPLDYIKKPLDSGEDQHMYQMAHFIKYLTDRGMNFKDLFETTMNSSDGVLKSIDDYSTGKGKPLPELYSEFSMDFITNSVTIKRAEIKDSVYEDLADYQGEFNYTYSETESRAVSISGNCTTSITAYKITNSDDNVFKVNISALQPTSGINVQYIVTSSPDINDIVKDGNMEAGKPLELKVKDEYYIYFVVTNTDSEEGSVTVAIEKPFGYSSHQKTWEAKIYNQTYSAKVTFKILCSQPFTIKSEGIYMNEELYRLEIKTVDDLPTDRDLVVNASIDISDLSYVSGNAAIPNVSEAYWQYGGQKVPEKNAVLSISANKPPPGRMIYSLVITRIDPNTGEELWAGGGNLVNLLIYY
ncbi:MAG: hypothetical protein ACOCQN_00680 [Halanaerobiaceae bacterium]